MSPVGLRKKQLVTRRRETRSGQSEAFIRRNITRNDEHSIVGTPVSAVITRHVIARDCADAGWRSDRAIRGRTVDRAGHGKAGNAARLAQRNLQAVERLRFRTVEFFSGERWVADHVSEDRERLLRAIAAGLQRVP